jgi:hypothetical protein
MNTRFWAGFILGTARVAGHPLMLSVKDCAGGSVIPHFVGGWRAGWPPRRCRDRGLGRLCSDCSDGPGPQVESSLWQLAVLNLHPIRECLSTIWRSWDLLAASVQTNALTGHQASDRLIERPRAQLHPCPPPSVGHNAYSGDHRGSMRSSRGHCGSIRTVGPRLCPSPRVVRSILVLTSSTNL